MGYLLASLSIFLVSIAQLIMKYALSRLPPLWSLREFLHGELRVQLLLGSGIVCYLLSLAVWYFTLKRLPLGKAYSLLSLSYVLVWFGAVLLPAYHEMFSYRAVVGVVAIMIGVLLVCWPQRESKVPKREVFKRHERTCAKRVG